MLASNETRRVELEGQLESLAKDHRTLERNVSRAAFEGRLRSIGGATIVDRRRSSRSPARAESRASGYMGESSDDEFFDAPMTMPLDAESDANDRTPTPTPRGSPSVVDRSRTGSGTPIAADGRQPPQLIIRRTKVPFRLDETISLWSVMKSCIGKDLSKIAMPVNFSEPLSFTQRLCEDMEYSPLLDVANRLDDEFERAAYVGAFVNSAFASGADGRTGKPFNPLLGETFELDRRAELGWRAFVEQVSHHPPICAMHCEADGWVYWQECSFSSKFRGKYLEVIPTGLSHLVLKRSGDHFTWTKISTVVHNIIVGKLWVDQDGTLDITSHRTGIICQLK